MLLPPFLMMMRDPIESCHPCRLERIYEQRFGGGGASSGSSASAVSLEEAQRNCMPSVAAYAVVQYILQLKVRLRFRVSAAPYGTQMARHERPCISSAHSFPCDTMIVRLTCAVAMCRIGTTAIS